MNTPKVLIDGQVYVPASSNLADPTARAIINALTSGWYTQPACHVDGRAPKPNCNCSACRVYCAARAFLGFARCEKETDPGFKQLYDSSAL